MTNKLRDHLYSAQIAKAVDYNILRLKELERIHDDHGRFYATPSGKRLPSVTTIIGHVSDNTWLERWREAVGEEEAERVRVEASERGEDVHAQAERYMLGEVVTMNDFTSTNYWWFFQQIRKYIDRNISMVNATEAMVYSYENCYAGTLDLAGVYRDKRSIIDFKNFDKPKPDEWVFGAILQCVLYAIGLEETTDDQLGERWKAEQVVVLIANGGGRPRELIEPITPALRAKALLIPELYNKARSKV